MSSDVEPDGLNFDQASLQAAVIKEGADYEGVRLKAIAYLGTARIPLQVDIGFGDVVSAETPLLTFPTLLDLPAPRIRSYPLESVIAEKFHALVALDMANSRMKDFYDLALLAQTYDFDFHILKSAITATFERRNTALPSQLPAGLSNEFANLRNAEWNAFLRRTNLEADAFDAIVKSIGTFFLPLLQEENRQLSWVDGRWTE